MTTIETGDFRGPLTIDHSREIHGAVSGPVTVTAGACLVVKGSLTGPLRIHKDAIVTVFGLVMDRDRPEQVRADGTCEEIATGDGRNIVVNIETEADDYVAYDSSTGRFRPLPAAS